jgi:hypothetical protein
LQTRFDAMVSATLLGRDEEIYELRGGNAQTLPRILRRRRSRSPALFSDVECVLFLPTHLMIDGGASWAPLE